MAEWVTITAGVAYGAKEGARVSRTRPSGPSRYLLHFLYELGSGKKMHNIENKCEMTKRKKDTLISGF